MAGGRKRKGLRRRRSQTEFTFTRSTKRSRVVATWSLVFSLVALVAIGAAVFLWIRKGGRAKAVAGSQRVPIREVVSRFPSPGEKEALGIVKKACQADDVAVVQTYFKLDDVTPAAALEILREIRRAGGDSMDYQWLGSTDRNGLLIDSVLERPASAAGREYRIAPLTPNPAGIWKVDFHAYARTCVPTWSEITRPDSKGGTVRVVFGRDTYFNGVFADEETWTCHALQCSVDDAPILGYCRKETPQHAALERIFRRARTSDVLQIPPHAVLEIRRVPGAEARQFEIVRVLAEGWVMAPTPFDETR